MFRSHFFGVASMTTTTVATSPLEPRSPAEISAHSNLASSTRSQRYSRAVLMPRSACSITSIRYSELLTGNLLICKLKVCLPGMSRNRSSFLRLTILLGLRTHAMWTPTAILADPCTSHGPLKSLTGRSRRICFRKKDRQCANVVVGWQISCPFQKRSVRQRLWPSETHLKWVNPSILPHPRRQHERRDHYFKSSILSILW